MKPHLSQVYPENYCPLALKYLNDTRQTAEWGPAIADNDTWTWIMISIARGCKLWKDKRPKMIKTEIYMKCPSHTLLYGSRITESIKRKRSLLRKTEHCLDSRERPNLRYKGMYKQVFWLVSIIHHLSHMLIYYYQYLFCIAPYPAAEWGLVLLIWRYSRVHV